MRQRKVRWQDGTTDPYADNYKEIITKKTYWEHEQDRQPLDSEGFMVERSTANPDVLSEDAVEFGGEAYPPMELRLMHLAIDKLTGRQREAFELIYRQGLTEKEAAKKLGISQPSLHRLAAKAMANVRKYMGVSE